MCILTIVTSLLGFKKVGIARNSIAALMMRIATIISGGAMSTGTILGSIVAWLQRITMA